MEDWKIGTMEERSWNNGMMEYWSIGETEEPKKTKGLLSTAEMPRVERGGFQWSSIPSFRTSKPVNLSKVLLTFS